MDIYRAEIRKILNEFEDCLKQYTIEHDRMPEGHLICCMNDGKRQFMQVDYGIPFRYEQVIPIGVREFSADFTFEAADKSEFFWEHAGMMDDPEYAEKHLRKLITYQKVGVLPGSNLLISYDRKGDLNMATVESMIRNEVIPRL